MRFHVVSYREIFQLTMQKNLLVWCFLRIRICRSATDDATETDKFKMTMAVFKEVLKLFIDGSFYLFLKWRL